MLVLCPLSRAKRGCKQLWILLFILAILLVYLIYNYNLNISNSKDASKSHFWKITRISYPVIPRIKSEGHYLKFYENLYKPTLSDELASYNICLATQTSIDRAFSIIEVAESWKGPISLAIGARNHEEIPLIQNFLKYMTLCRDWFKNTVSVHVGIPQYFNEEIDNENEFTIPIPLLAEKDTNLNCDVLKSDLLSILTNEVKNLDYSYPQNHYRNLARRNCNTYWTVLTDIDIIPKYNSAKELDEFLRTKDAKNCTNCAYVIPIFEIQSIEKLPITKKELLKLEKSNLARPFHVKFWSKAQLATNYEEWRTTNLEEEPIKISHDSSLFIQNFTKTKNYYEPFYVGPKSMPAYDERFVGFGSVRNSQIFESYVAGWEFKVLTPIFATHYGYKFPITKNKTMEYKHSTRYKENDYNGKHYVKFMKEVWEKYQDQSE